MCGECIHAKNVPCDPVLLWMQLIWSIPSSLIFKVQLQFHKWLPGFCSCVYTWTDWFTHYIFYCRHAGHQGLFEMHIYKKCCLHKPAWRHTEIVTRESMPKQPFAKANGFLSHPTSHILVVQNPQTESVGSWHEDLHKHDTKHKNVFMKTKNCVLPNDTKTKDAVPCDVK